MFEEERGVLEDKATHCFALMQDKNYAHSVISIKKSLVYRSPSKVWSDFYHQPA